MKNRKNKLLSYLGTLVLLTVFLFGGMRAFADNDNNKNQNNGTKIQVSANCPPGHMHAPGWLKHVFKKKINDPCSTAGDVTAPVMSNIVVSNITSTSAVISWDTNEATKGKIMYGTTTSYGSTTTSGSSWWKWLSGNMTTHHVVTLTGLSANTTYHFQVVSTDRAGNTTKSSDMTLKTLSGIVGTAPVISNINVSDITAGSAKITFMTNENTTSTINYGTTSSYGSNIADNVMKTNHEMSLTGLSANTTYHFQVRVRDADGNVISSDDMNLKTAATDTTGPVISGAAVSDINNNSVKISWTTNEPSTTKVQFGTTTLYGRSVTSDVLTTSHSITLPNLAGATTYHYRLISTDSSGNTTTTNDSTFMTLANDTTSPVISNASVSSINSTGATISWTTNESATTKVEYGTTTSYGTVINPSGMTTDHNVVLSGLVPNTTYHYKITSRDASGNTISTSDATFMTSADSTAPVISNISVGSLTTSGAVITWKTNENSTTQVRYGTTTSYGNVVNNDSLTMNHTMALTGLAPGTTYHYKVVSVDAGGNTAMSTDGTFATLANPADVTPPVISAISTDDLTGNSVNINWTTNEQSTSKIYYSTTTPFVNSSASSVSDSTLRTSHTLTLSGLTSGTIYYYVIESRDSSGNITYSTERSLTTLM